MLLSGLLQVIEAASAVTGRNLQLEQVDGGADLMPDAAIPVLPHPAPLLQAVPEGLTQ